MTTCHRRQASFLYYRDRERCLSAETGRENVRFFLFRCTPNADMAPPEQSAIRSTIGTAAIRHILKTNGIVPDPDGDCPAGGVRVLEDAQLPIPTG